MGATLSICDLTKAFGQTHVLSQICLDVQAGSFVSLLGPSGCGKSTLLRIIAGFEAQDQGMVSVNGHSIDHLPPRARNLAMVFQSYALYPHMTVGENISLPLEMDRLSTFQRLPLLGRCTPGQRMLMADITEEVRKVASIAEIDHLLDRRPAQLSGGQRQRVALARAMVRAPGLFLMDEPLSNLDAKLRVTMRSELVAMNKRLDATVLYVTHDQTEAMTMSDRIALMMGGQILQYDTPEAIYTAPAHIDVARFIGHPSINCIPALNDAGVVIAEAERCNIRTAEREQKITLGIRPEAFALRPAPTAKAVLGIPVSLDRVELLGPEVLLWCTAKRTGRVLVAQARAADHRAMVESGLLTGSLWLEAYGSGLHLFDPSGKAIPITNALGTEIKAPLAAVS
ncbi:ABC transporter ATP-binding protein [Agrobacterium sp. LAD9]|uniref:ABC transporter ATP-binding protein n=1 Tax=Agrobacterium sp. LAD9 TaxID=2055153 RepID=UPI000D1F31F9|nr:ABC transporter ATP-binding protein [Agrobacterium sp. LAD9]